MQAFQSWKIVLNFLELVLTNLSGLGSETALQMQALQDKKLKKFDRLFFEKYAQKIAA